MWVVLGVLLLFAAVGLATALVNRSGSRRLDGLSQARREVGARTEVDPFMDPTARSGITGSRNPNNLF